MGCVRIASLLVLGLRIGDRDLLRSGAGTRSLMESKKVGDGDRLIAGSLVCGGRRESKLNGDDMLPNCSTDLRIVELVD